MSKVTAKQSTGIPGRRCVRATSTQAQDADFGQSWTRGIRVQFEIVALYTCYLRHRR